MSTEVRKLDRAVTRVANGIYSYLSPAQLRELKRCLAIAYPNNAAKQKRDYITLACQPNAAAGFIQHPDFRVQS